MRFRFFPMPSLTSLLSGIPFESNIAEFFNFFSINLRIGIFLFFVPVILGEPFVSEGYGNQFGDVAFDIAARYKKNGISTSWAEKLCEQINSHCERDYSLHSLARAGVSRRLLDALAHEWCNSSSVILVFSLERGESQKRFSSNDILYEKRICFNPSGWQRLINRVPELEQLVLQHVNMINLLVQLLAGNRVDLGVVENAVIVRDRFILRHAAEIVFNENSLFFINNGLNGRCQRFENFFEKLKKFVRENKLNVEELCIDGSSVLALFGLRDVGTDLDFIVHNTHMLDRFDLDRLYPVEVHNKWHKNVDDVIFNPLNYFYVDGFKVASLQFIRKFKKLRNWPKDKKDVLLIQRFLEKKK